MIKKTILLFTISLFISNLQASLVHPENGRNLNYIHVLFEWEQEPNTDSYHIQLSDSFTFNNIILDATTETNLYIDEQNIDWDSSYYWRVRPIYSNNSFGDWIGPSEFSTNEPFFSNINIDIANEDLIEDGYVAIGGFAPALQSVIIDQYGNEVWNDGGFQFLLNHINEYGNIYGFSAIDYPLNTGMKSNMNMDVVWNTMDSSNPIDSHEIKQLPNGNYMAFINEYAIGPLPNDNYMTEYFQAIGYQADGVTPEFNWYGQKLIEWNQDHEVVWSWNPFDYFTMQDYDNYEGTWYNAYFEGEYDWMHSNAFHFDQEESVIYVSHRHLSRISKIAYPEGDVIWNMGLPSEYMASGAEHICTDLLFSFQHNIQLLDNGDLLFFDNGNLSDMLLEDSNPTSRIRRIRVVDDSYCETIWQYDLPQNLMGLGMGSVQLLDNGNYSIYTFGSGLGNPECSVIEVTSNQEIVWKATSSNPNAAWYRSYKIPSLHPDAFSVIADEYIVDNNDNNIISILDNSLEFTISNESDYDLLYKYIFTDLLDGGNPLFNYSDGELYISSNSDTLISFPKNFESNLFETQIMLSVWPIYHEYALKELEFTVTNNTLLGDANYDGNIDVIDVVLIVNMILGNQELELEVSDLNNDQELNVVDIVILVNLILSVQ